MVTVVGATDGSVNTAGIDNQNTNCNSAKLGNSSESTSVMRQMAQFFGKRSYPAAVAASDDATSCSDVFAIAESPSRLSETRASINHFPRSLRHNDDF